MNHLFFTGLGTMPGNLKWEEASRRSRPIYKWNDELRSPFSRDYNRIMHCDAFRRLKHKTQVFFATTNDHICTRIEHVNHVAAVSQTICQHLGLNTELAAAIALGHDLGHAPFGHAGESILRSIALKHLPGGNFWHEKNSLRFIDYIETLPSTFGEETNLNLTYGVRDGIICHCGEVDDIALAPRAEAIALEKIEKASQVPPYTWEGCVVKLADKIAYLGRDIEDALALDILAFSQLKDVARMARRNLSLDIREINNTVLIHCFIIDLCHNSSATGLSFSPEYYAFMQGLKQFCRDNVYTNPRLVAFQEYAELVIRTIFQTLMDLYIGEDTLELLLRKRWLPPTLVKTFSEWMIKYSRLRQNREQVKAIFGYNLRFDNHEVYDFRLYDDYACCVIDYISGMTDAYAIRVFKEIISF